LGEKQPCRPLKPVFEVLAKAFAKAGALRAAKAFVPVVMRSGEKL
jgi:hypothetical protein